MAATFATPRLGRSKSGADVLFDKMKQKQYQTEEKLAIDFLNTTLDQTIPCGQLHKELKDGVVLCNLVNKIRPGTIKHVGQKDLSFVKMDNITRFLQGARQLGLADSQLFETIDLFEAKDMLAVIHTILTLAQLFGKPNSSEDSLKDREVQVNKEADEITDQEHMQLPPQHRPNKEHNDTDKNDTTDDTEEVDPQDPASCDDVSDMPTEAAAAPAQPSQDTKYRHVRDIFGASGESHTEPESTAETVRKDHSKKTAGFDEDAEWDTASLSNPSTPSSLSRPPKSPLRPHSKRAPTNGSLRSNKHGAGSQRGSRRPSAPVIAVRHEGAPMARSPSSSSTCSSSSSVMSSETPITPSSGVCSPKHMDEHSKKQSRSSVSTKSSYQRRQSVSFPHGNHGNQPHDQNKTKGNPTTGSLGHKLDRQLMNTVQTLKEDEKVREKLILKAKDGSTSAQYQLGNCIGKGQFGAVYRALDLATGETVAVKRIKLEDDEHDTEMMKEVSLLKTLSHVNVIQYLGFIRSKHNMNIVLEYAENGSLMSTLKSFGAFPEKLVASFCIKILNGLEYLHSNEVVHCDLKAANILTTKTGDVKLTDFGVSLNLKLKGADDAGTVNGTPNWMAPEVIELKGASTKSDIWSLGCTLVELVTGKPPYADLIAMSAMFRIVEDNYPPLPDTISEDMRSFLLSCFQKSPEDRPTAAQLKEHIWIQKNLRSVKKTDTYASGLSSVTSSRKLVLDMAYNPADRQSYDGERENTHRPSIHRSVDVGLEKDTMSVKDFLLEEDADYVTHRFIQTSFGKVVECKICSELLTEHAIFCEVCALICHEGCKKSAFSCPPKVNDQQPSYDWVFSAKIYNRSSQERRSYNRAALPQEFNSLRSNSLRRPSPASLHGHPQAESIRKYSKALGLTAQEQQALLDNPALLSHTMAMENSIGTDSSLAEKIGRRRKDGKRLTGVDEQCIIS